MLGIKVHTRRRRLSKCCEWERKQRRVALLCADYAFVTHRRRAHIRRGARAFLRRGPHIMRGRRKLNKTKGGRRVTRRDDGAQCVGARFCSQDDAGRRCGFSPPSPRAAPRLYQIELRTTR